MESSTTGANGLYGSPSFGELIAEALDRYPERDAFRADGVATTYRALAQRISRACQMYEAIGLDAGDGLAVLAGNAVDTYALLAAGYISGLRVVTLHTRGGEADHAFILSDSEARVLIVEPDFEERAVSLRRTCPQVEHWLSSGPSRFLEDFWASASRFQPQSLLPRGDDDTIVRLAYTGGTTGRPKGVVITNRTIRTQSLTLLSATCFADPPRYLCALPITHGAGGLITAILIRGGCVVLKKRFEPETFIEAIVGERCNATWMVPTTIYALLDHPRTREVDWSGLRTLVYSGAPMAPARIREALDVFGPCLIQMYGQAEAPAHVLLMTQDEHAHASAEQLAAAGKPFPGVRVALLDDDNQPVAPGEPGEICVRGPLVMAGYWKQPELTEAAFAGGWLHTGDIARQDRDGYYYIVDRKKDMLISGGFNVYPREVEDVLARHASVSQVAVIGTPDSKWGEVVTAYIVLRKDSDADVRELMEMVRAEKGEIHVPRLIHFVDDLPLTSVGKVDKKALRALASSTEANRSS